MAACDNCYLFDQMKLHKKSGFFETRKQMAIFILNVILNICSFNSDFCECDDENICYPCDMAVILDEEEVYSVNKNCLDLQFLSQFKEKLHEHFCKLYGLKNHFLCRIIEEQFHYHQKCFFYWLCL